jgi:hypothetical protein
MKAISMWQPWASLYCSDDKEHETRHWPTNYRGWLLVHAAKKLVSDCGEELDSIVCDRFGPLWRTELPRGAIIGAVHIVACKRTEDLLKEWGCPPEPVPVRHYIDLQCGDFSDGRYAWERSEFRLFKTPVPYRGAQGFFNVPRELVPEAPIL